MKVNLFILLILLCLTSWQYAFAAYQVGDTVEDFKLLDSNGNFVALSDYTGLPVLLNFWSFT